MRLVLTIGSTPIEFNEQSSDGPFPYLVGVTGPKIQARAGYISGFGVGEAPSMTASLDNTDKRLATIIADALRCRADHYEDDGSLSFSGVVSGIKHGCTTVLSIGG